MLSICAWVWGHSLRYGQPIAAMTLPFPPSNHLQSSAPWVWPQAPPYPSHRNSDQLVFTTSLQMITATELVCAAATSCLDLGVSQAVLLVSSDTVSKHSSAMFLEPRVGEVDIGGLSTTEPVWAFMLDPLTSLHMNLLLTGKRDISDQSRGWHPPYMYKQK